MFCFAISDVVVVVFPGLSTGVHTPRRQNLRRLKRWARVFTELCSMQHGCTCSLEYAAHLTRACTYARMQYICTHACAHAHALTHAYTHIHSYAVRTHMHTHTYTRMQYTMHTHIHSYVCVHTCIHTHTLACSTLCIHTHTLIRMRTHMHTHTYTHTYAHTHMQHGTAVNLFPSFRPV